MTYLAIALGGAFGAVFRALMINGVTRALPAQGLVFPWGTLLVNVLGSAMMGMVFILAVERGALTETQRAFVMVGLLGAFTTFSTFSMDTISLIQQNALWQAGSYILASVIICLLGTWLGMALTRAVT